MEITPPIESNMAEVKKEEPDGIGPEITAALSFSETEWEQWLRECFPTFKGNYQRAAVLLRSFVQGMKYVSDRLAKKSLKNAYPPHFVILQRDIQGATDLGYCHAVNAATVKLSMLELCSQLQIDLVGPFQKGNETCYTGTIREAFTLAGAEEMHHALFCRYKGEPTPAHAIATSLATYDQEDIEFRALLWKLRYAKNYAFREDSIQSLQKRIDAARRVREQQKTTHTFVQSLQEKTQ